MNRIIKFMTGELGIEDFEKQFIFDNTLQSEVDSLLPQEAIGNKDHKVWSTNSYDAYAESDFSCSKLIFKICKFNHRISDDLRLFGTIEYLFRYQCPETACTTIYYDKHDLYLDVIQDCFDGPEVELLINEIINSVMIIPSKAGRKRIAREKVRKYFHIQDNKRPRWINGAEWPMGLNSPMKYTRRVTNGEAVQFMFVDVDTGIERTITQFY